MIEATAKLGLAGQKPESKDPDCSSLNADAVVSGHDEQVIVECEASWVSFRGQTVGVAVVVG